MKPAAPLMSLEEALDRLVVGAQPCQIRETETVALFDALRRVLARPIHSLIDVPPGDNTSMDGYAVRVADVPQPGVRLQVAQRIPAGQVGRALEPGTAARIFTGAQVPPGADAVVMQELCEGIAGPGLGEVIVNTVPQAGQWIRRRGEDVQEGAVLLEAGTRLSPQALGLAASVGCAAVVVRRRPRVALFSTGDELVMPGDVPPHQMRPGAIYNSNRYTLRGLLQAAGCDVTDWGIVPDRLDATRTALRDAAADHDLILTSGGVSVGEEDHIKPAVQAEGQLDLWQLAIKPGKPLAFGSVRRDAAWPCLFVGLPGNPVSSFVTFLVAVAPLLRVLQGMEPQPLKPQSWRADFQWQKPDRRREFLRARPNGEGGLALFPNQSSGVLTSAVWAEGLIDNPPGATIERGQMVLFLPFADLLAA
ncbi:MAG: gephyrin-like molybdotransferase Glp [Burkholderiaceae bacterium]|jgi:molybdopterin molybdotransferase